MMRFRIHFTVRDPKTDDAHEDSVIVVADTIKALTALAKNEVKRRGGYDAWSEEIP